MVKKLIKYDFSSYLRLLLPVQLVLIGIAALNRIIQLFEDTSSSVYNIIFVSSLVLYFIAIAVCLLLTTIVAIVRFYQGMYTNEGYLTHTLPVTPSQHIFAKLIISVIFDIGSLVAVFLSFMVITLGEMNIEIFKAGFFLLGKAFEHLEWHMVIYAVEVLVLMLVAQATAYLMLYFCISIGQLASKKKVLLAFGVFFGLYVLTQILGTVAIIIVTNMDYKVIERISGWIADNYKAFMHLANGCAILIEAVLGAVYFLIIRFIMSKKLNLT